ncbi:Clp protease N-terminal domain-containing protein [Humibacter albus]|uniref:Clp protease N-terminal domain-containing protein n=1 Tax=Humibacter albus TaxID=427754 RepID=UPI0003B71277|nr:Clp protease N-terminal domain-containing protein [Humibacter albus]
MADDTSRAREDRIPQPMRDIMIGATQEAQRRGSAAVAAEHLMLAILAQDDSPASAVLADFGLDHAALDSEIAHSLAVIGIEGLDSALLEATGRDSRPMWSSSIREAFRRAQSSGRRRRRAAELDLLYGIVTANVGTVPRTLAYAGIDRDALIGRVERERLASDDEDPRPGHQGATAQERQAMRREAARRGQAGRRDTGREHP